MAAELDRLLLLNMAGCGEPDFVLLAELSRYIAENKVSSLHTAFNFFVSTEKSLHPFSPHSEKAKTFFISNPAEIRMLRRLAEEVKKHGIQICCTPFDVESVSCCEELACDYFRLPAAGVDDWPLLEAVAVTGLPLVVPGHVVAAEALNRVELFLSNRQLSYGLSGGERQQVAEGSLGSLLSGAEGHDRNALFETVSGWLKEAVEIFDGATPYPCSAVGKSLSVCIEKDFVRGLYTRQDVPAGGALNEGNSFLALLGTDDQLRANQMSKYCLFRLKEAVAAGRPICLTQVEKRRVGVDAFKGPPASLEMSEERVAGIDCLSLRQKERQNNSVLIFLHGGGFVSGCPVESLASASRLAAAGSFDVLSVAYRRAPKHPYPAAVDDVVRVYLSLLERGVAPGNIGFWGESAGGGLALAAVQSLIAAGNPAPAAICCSSPWADLTNSGDSHDAEMNRADITLKTTILDQNAREYAGGEALASPGVSPLFGDFRMFPPLLLFAGTREILLADAVAVAERAQRCNVPVDLRLYEGMPHVFTSMTGSYEEAVEAMEVAARFFRDKLTGEA